ncbi:hypothetical protein BST95_01745 [Halioglobus japonicus]|uniref:DUF3237 domain-containing protein n=1 Tax=Halioglobus japonicus TaxID=930805 RepID=A0AAP8SLZ9_9GAMM|nr:MULTISPECIES: DUF3237 domain-containing protein [Halioglobus]AQA17128.1 hypothetical protein BST95_01745 [Halioglobus japonicus]KZX58299.1 hypothetical protein A3709_02215 [Halioglobus sp. HI00S01]PLW85037.1 DUF3237 domain-containing protein [Halioglobus japonicus]GHD19146.1 hypothetical protein GCM10007052_27260 [Halioglobus japonicus]
MPQIELHPLARIEAKLGEPVNVGRGPLGSRVVIDVTSVKLTGERINAELATNDAADWATFSEDGTVASLDVRLTLKTDDGEFIFVEYTGRMETATGLIAVAPTFQTGSERYAWLNSIQAVSAGQVDQETGVLVYEMYEARPVA